MKWSNIKRHLTTLDNRELVRLIGELHGLSNANRNFLDARFGDQDLAIEAYRRIVDECMYPDTRRRWSLEVAQAKRAVREYEKASGDLRGTADLMVYFVERGVEFCSDHGYVEDALQGALLRMYAQVIHAVQSLPKPVLGVFRERLAAVVKSAEYDPVFWEAVREIYDDAFDQI